MQGIAQVPLLVPTLPSGQQKPLELQLPLQHGVPPAVQGELLPVGMHIVWHGSPQLKFPGAPKQTRPAAVHSSQLLTCGQS